MQTIQLQATYTPGFQFPETVALQMATPAPANDENLDDALAIVLQAVRQSGNPDCMDALGTLLAYMEGLERKQTRTGATEAIVTLASPLTLTF